MFRPVRQVAAQGVKSAVFDYILYFDRIARIAQMRYIATDVTRSMVCLSVCWAYK